MAFRSPTNTRVPPANNRAVDVAKQAIEGLIDVQQRRYLNLNKKQQKRFVHLIKADKNRLKELSDQYIDSPIRKQDENRMRGLLIQKFVPEMIEPCIICGSHLEYKGWTAGFGNFGFPRYCRHHSPKEKRIATNKERYGFEWANYHPDIRAKEEATRMEKYGAKTIFESKAMQKKIKKIFRKKYGGDTPMASKKVRDKIAKTNLKRYGATAVWGSEYGRERRRYTMMERYGVEHALQNDAIYARVKEKFIEKYGVDNPLKDKSIRKRIKKLISKKYGVEEILSSKDIRKKINDTVRDRYGVDHISQHPEIFKRIEDNRWGRTPYVTKQGKPLSLQGYEPKVAEILESRGFKISKFNGNIPYKDFDGKSRRYYPDLIAKRKGRKYVVEVKSSYTLLGKPGDTIFRTNRRKFKSTSKEHDLLLAVLHEGRLFLVRDPAQFNKAELSAVLGGSLKTPDVRRIKWQS